MGVKEMTGVITLSFTKGKKGNIISRLPSGKIALINKNYKGVKPKEGEKWLCKVDFERPNFVVITPIVKIVTKEAKIIYHHKCGHIEESIFTKKVEVPENEEPDPIHEHSNTLCSNCLKHIRNIIKEFLDNLVAELINFVAQGLIIPDTSEEQEKLKKLYTEYKKYCKEKEKYIKEWLRNARITYYRSGSYEDEDSWGPSLDYSCSAETREYDGIKVTFDPDIPHDLELKLRQAVSKSDKPFAVKLRELESEIKATRDTINEKYAKAFDELLEKYEKVKALFSLLTDEEYLDPLIPIFESALEKAKKIIDSETKQVIREYLKNELPKTLGDLIRMVKSRILYDIDAYDGCFGDLRNLGDYKKIFLEYLYDSLKS